MKKIFRFFNNYSFRIFYISLFMSIIFISLSMLFFLGLFIYFLNKNLELSSFFNNPIIEIALSELFKSFKYTSSISFVILIISCFIISKKIIKPIKNLSNKIKLMVEDNELFLLEEEGYNEFIELSQIWNFLLVNTIELKSQSEDLSLKSNTDGLTKLYNHKYFIEQLQSTISNKNSIVSLIFFDLDKFKSINDTYGHLVGDKVLSTVSNIIKSTIVIEGYANESIVGRYGGEEITVMLKDVDKKTAFEIAEKIRLKIYNSRKIQEFLPDRIVTISAGIASFPNDAYNVNDLIESADKAMYHSKSNGRNQSTIYTKELSN